MLTYTPEAMAQVHSLGPSCVLHEGSNEFTRRASGISDEAPKIKANFFYSSALPIDDPLSPIPTPSTSYQLGTSKVHPPRPFSAYDNAALEEAWQGLQAHDCQDHKEGAASSSKPGKTLKGKETRRAPSSQDHGDADASGPKHGRFGKTKSSRHDKVVVAEETSSDPNESNVNNEANIVQEAKDLESPGVKAGKEADKSVTGKRVTYGASPSTAFHVGSTRTQDQSDSHVFLCDEPQYELIDESRLLTADELAVSEGEGEPSEPSKKHRRIFHRRSSPKKEKDQASLGRSRSPSRHKAKILSVIHGTSPSERHTTGTPFLRAPSPSRPEMSGQSDGIDAASDDEGKKLTAPKPSMRRFHSDNSGSRQSDSESGFRSKLHSAKKANLFGRKEQKAYVPVGLSRLHLVEMPALEVMIPVFLLKHR